MRERVRPAWRRLVVAWLALGLAACGPGTGGTGLPPGDGGDALSTVFLEALQRAHQPSDLPSQVAAMGINGGIGDGLKRLFMTHPPLEERIEVLRAGL
jgi:hypothetical protein